MMFSNKDKMPEHGSITFKILKPNESFTNHMHKRFSQRGLETPCGVGSNGQALLRYNTWDPDTDQTFTVTQEDFVRDNIHIRRLVFLYWG